MRFHRSIGVWRPHSNASRFHRDDRACTQLRTVLGERFRRGRSLAFSGETNQPNNASVGHAMNHRKFAEIFVDCDDDLRGVKRAAEDFSIAWILRGGDRLDFMASHREHTRGSSPDTRVEEHLHRD
jgi:hypothetical protein